jgi:hypothetical protein
MKLFYVSLSVRVAVAARVFIGIEDIKLGLPRPEARSRVVRVLTARSFGFQSTRFGNV